MPHIYIAERTIRVKPKKKLCIFLIKFQFKQHRQGSPATATQITYSTHKFQPPHIEPCIIFIQPDTFVRSKIGKLFHLARASPPTPQPSTASASLVFNSIYLYVCCARVLRWKLSSAPAQPPTHSLYVPKASRIKSDRRRWAKNIQFDFSASINKM